MIIELTGPRKGQTVKLHNTQFINGEADVVNLSPILERYYGVREKETVEIVEPQKDTKDEDFLKEVVELKKEELKTVHKEASKDWKAMPFLARKSYIKTLTGKAPKNGDEAIAIMKEAGYE